MKRMLKMLSVLTLTTIPAANVLACSKPVVSSKTNLADLDLASLNLNQLNSDTYQDVKNKVLQQLQSISLVEDIEATDFEIYATASKAMLTNDEIAKNTTIAINIVAADNSTYYTGEKDNIQLSYQHPAVPKTDFASLNDTLTIDSTPVGDLTAFRNNLIKKIQTESDFSNLQSSDIAILSNPLAQGTQLQPDQIVQGDLIVYIQASNSSANFTGSKNIEVTITAAPKGNLNTIQPLSTKVEALENNAAEFKAALKNQYATSTDNPGFGALAIDDNIDVVKGDGTALQDSDITAKTIQVKFVIAAMQTSMYFTGESSIISVQISAQADTRVDLGLINGSSFGVPTTPAGYVEGYKQNIIKAILAANPAFAKLTPEDIGTWGNPGGSGPIAINPRSLEGGSTNEIVFNADAGSVNFKGTTTIEVNLGAVTKTDIKNLPTKINVNSISGNVNNFITALETALSQVEGFDGLSVHEPSITVTKPNGDPLQNSDITSGTLPVVIKVPNGGSWFFVGTSPTINVTLTTAADARAPLSTLPDVVTIPDANVTQLGSIRSLKDNIATAIQAISGFSNFTVADIDQLYKGTTTTNLATPDIVKKGYIQVTISAGDRSASYSGTKTIYAVANTVAKSDLTTLPSAVAISTTAGNVSQFKSDLLTQLATYGTFDALPVDETIDVVKPDGTALAASDIVAGTLAVKIIINGTSDYFINNSNTITVTIN